MAAGTAVAAVITELAGLMVTGLIAGAAVGAARGTVLSRDAALVVAWSAVTAAGWAIAWLVTYTVVGVNADQGFFVFGSSGALVAT